MNKQLTCSYSDWAFLGLLGLGGGVFRPLLNFRNVTAITTKLSEQIAHPKLFPLKSTT